MVMPFSSRSTIGRLTAALLLVGSVTAEAQPEVIFGTGQPQVFREAEMDRRFSRSRVGRALAQGVRDPNCAQLLGGLLTVLGEVGPRLHKRDENFYVDPYLLQALGTQVGNPGFPANAYLASMVRRVLIDRKLPQEWLETGTLLAPALPTVDVGKLRFLADGVRPIDSFLLTLPMLRERHEIELARATTAAAVTQDLAFRDAYVDREVAFGELTLLDIRPETAERKGKKRKALDADEALGLVARLQWRPPAPEDHEIMPFQPKKKAVSVTVTARLSPKQYVDIEKLPRGKRMLVRGRLWAIGKRVSSVELRDALLFEDRDWSMGALLANPAAVAQCPLAVNDLTGIAPHQPGGFAH